MEVYEILRETIERKYDREVNPMVYKEKAMDYMDSLVPHRIFSRYDDDNTSKFLSPNMRNFVNNPNNSEFGSFKDLDAFARNKYDIDFEKIIKNHNYDEKVTQLVVVGLGGYMSNMLYFLNEKFKEWNHSNYYNLFSKIVVYENDKFSLINNLRTFQDTSIITPYYANISKESKIHLLSNISQNNSTITSYVQANESYLGEYALENNIISNGHNIETLFIGSPDMETRKLLQDKAFLFFGNSNDDFIIESSPGVDSMVQETYGKINLLKFWLGILESMYAFCRILEKYDSSELKELPKDTTLFSLNVSKEFKDPNYFLAPEENREEQRQEKEE